MLFLGILGACFSGAMIVAGWQDEEWEFCGIGVAGLVLIFAIEVMNFVVK